jgi:hypothetical protein
MRWNAAKLAGLAAGLATIIAPATAAADSLTLRLGATAEVGAPYAITAEGEVGVASRLYVYVDPGGEACAPTPARETSETFSYSALSAVGGDPLSAGAFAIAYAYTPLADNVYGVCAYVDDLPEAPTTAVASAGFSVPSGPVEAPYLGEAAEQFKPIAVEQEQREERERAQRRREQEESESVPASERVLPETPAAGIAPAPVVHCVVPLLTERSLIGARRALRKARCSLGRVRRSHHVRGRLVVVRQSARRGVELRAGAAIAVVLGRARR